MITQEELKERFEYNKETGVFKPISGSRAFNGKRVGGVNSEGYLLIRINGKAYRAHRLAFLYVEGKFPDLTVDHINRIKTDNRFSNLRILPQALNNQNKKMYCTNSSGFVGVSYAVAAKKWVSSIKINSKSIYIGSYDDKIDAAIARINYEDYDHRWQCNENVENRIKVMSAIKNRLVAEDLNLKMWGIS